MDNYIFIDLDGVILDSEERMLERKYNLGFINHEDKIEFYKYFEYTNTHLDEWDYIIKEAKSVNNSVEIIQELEKLQTQIAILTKIHTLYEMKIKTEDLRQNRNIKSPILFVPPGIKKSEIVIPNSQILIDDSIKNINDWICHNGKGILFDSALSEDTDQKVKSLEFLLRGKGL